MEKHGLEIPFTLVFGEDAEGNSLSEHPFAEEVDWIHQYAPNAPVSGYYLIEGDETAPTRIWHGQTNDMDAVFTCLYEDPELGENQ